MPKAKSTHKVTRRDVVKLAGVAGAAAVTTVSGPRIQKVRAASNVVRYAVIGTGSRGTYHIRHLNGIDGAKCVAACDIKEEAAREASKTSKDKPPVYKDYREVLARQDVDAVIIATPLYAHYAPTRDALLAGKHVLCEKSLVFKPEEVHGLRKVATERPKQVLQVGLQRRYSRFYQTVRQMIEKGVLGRVTHIQAQWHRNPGWTMRPGAWRLYRQYSGGLTAELASHQIDVADWMFGSHPEFVVGVGGNEFMKDGRDIFDNIQLIFKYPQGQKLVYTSICTNKHLPLFYSQRTEFGELIMGTEGTVHITVGADTEPALALWFYEPGPAKPGEAKKEPPAVAGATLAATGKGGRAIPVTFEEDDPRKETSFIKRELKFAKQWLYRRGVMVPEEDRNPVDVQLESFFDCCRTGARPKADLEIGLADSVSVILANLAMDEGRRVYFNEIDRMGKA
jgi:predicted dehydrogenase